MTKLDLILEGQKELKEDVKAIRSELSSRPCAVHAQQIAQLTKDAQRRSDYAKWVIGLLIGVAFSVITLIGVK